MATVKEVMYLYRATNVKTKRVIQWHTANEMDEILNTPHGNVNKYYLRGALLYGMWKIERTDRLRGKLRVQ